MIRARERMLLSTAQDYTFPMQQVKMDTFSCKFYDDADINDSYPFFILTLSLMENKSTILYILYTWTDIKNIVLL